MLLSSYDSIMIYEQFVKSAMQLNISVSIIGVS